MSSSTTNGLPYPVAADAIATQAATVQALAQAVDDKILAAAAQSNVTWAATAGTAPNKGATGVCNIRRRLRGRWLDFSLLLTLAGAGVSLGSSGGFQWVLPEAPLDFTRWAFPAITTAPNRQYVARFTAAATLQMFKTGQTSTYGFTDATADAWAAGTILAISGTYEV